MFAVECSRSPHHVITSLYSPQPQNHNQKHTHTPNAITSHTIAIEIINIFITRRYRTYYYQPRARPINEFHLKYECSAATLYHVYCMTKLTWTCVLFICRTYTHFDCRAFIKVCSIVKRQQKYKVFTHGNSTLELGNKTICRHSETTLDMVIAHNQ